VTRLNLIALVSGLAAAPLPLAAGQEPLWIRQFGTSGAERIRALAADGAGDVFVGGDTSGSLGGPFAGGTLDAWFARYDSSGSRVWVRQLGTSLYDDALAVALDSSGGVFVAGSTDGSLVGSSPLGQDPWLARHDAAGAQIWIRQFSPSGYDVAAGLASDGAGGVFIVGTDFNSVRPTGQYAFLARYDALGNRAWLRRNIGPNYLSVARALCPDGAGGVFIAGESDPGLTGGGPREPWLARLDAGGNQLWLREFGSSATDNPNAIASDGAGGVFVAGDTLGSLGGPNTGTWDIWLTRYDAAGNQTWIRQFGTSLVDRASALAADGAGGVLIAGETMGSLGGPNAGGDDAWMAAYDSAGTQTWLCQIGTGGSDRALALAPTGAGEFFIAGRTDGSLGGPNAGGADYFLAKYGPFCAADFNHDGTLSLQDIFDFLIAYFTADPRADFSHDGLIGVQDIFDFLAAYFAGCP
jgi:hypothetical protein